jgi:asparagine synthase (glutamine-hydrolysing)
MCGITGYWSPGASAHPDTIGRIAHRGTDAAGVWLDEGMGPALENRRLSIFDLSPAGAQPMISVYGRLVAHAIDRVMQHLPRRIRFPALGDRLVKLGGVLDQAEGAAFRRALVSQFQHPATIVHGATEPQALLSQPDLWPPLDDFRETMMYLDTLTYLPGDVLTKVDRATMAVSLEARVPFLDHGLMELARSLPLNMKLRGGQTKWSLRQVLFRYVPRGLIDRLKMGFGLPIEQWLSGPLRNWAQDLLVPDALRAEGPLDVGAVLSLWDVHLSGRRRWHHRLWTVLMFKAWHVYSKKLAPMGKPLFWI